MAKKKAHEMSPEEFNEYLKIKDSTSRLEEERLAEKDRRKEERRYAKSERVRLIAKKLDGEDNETMNRAVKKVPDCDVDANGRKIFNTEAGVLSGMGRSWIPVVGIDGEELVSVKDIYRHYDFNLPEGVIDDIDLASAEKFYENLRRNFGEQYACFLNTMVTKTTYSEFKGVSYVTISRWGRQRKLDIVEIDGVEFVWIPMEELNDFSEFLMLRRLKADPHNKKAEMERVRTMIVWEAKHGTKCDIEPMDSVKDWLSFQGLSNIEYGKKNRIPSENAYSLYRKFCRSEKIRPLETKNLFMKRIRELGFEDCHGEFRGFYWYPADRLTNINEKEV